MSTTLYLRIHLTEIVFSTVNEICGTFAYDVRCLKKNQPIAASQSLTYYVWINLFQTRWPNLSDNKYFLKFLHLKFIIAPFLQDIVHLLPTYNSRSPEEKFRPSIALNFYGLDANVFLSNFLLHSLCITPLNHFAK